MADHCLMKKSGTKDMHKQMARLYQAAKELCKTEGQTEVAALFNASPQLLNNWEARGISQKGMLRAEEIIGCSAAWLRTGEGPMRLTQARPEPGKSLEPLVGWGVLNEEELQLLLLFRDCDQSQKDTVMTMLHGLKRHGSTAVVDDQPKAPVLALRGGQGEQAW